MNGETVCNTWYISHNDHLRLKYVAFIIIKVNGMEHCGNNWTTIYEVTLIRSQAINHRILK
jgi:hypothetical protein